VIADQEVQHLAGLARHFLTEADTFAGRHRGRLFPFSQGLLLLLI
jgi:hypothetical protein